MERQAAEPSEIVHGGADKLKLFWCVTITLCSMGLYYSICLVVHMCGKRPYVVPLLSLELTPRTVL